MFASLLIRANILKRISDGHFGWSFEEGFLRDFFIVETFYDYYRFC